MKTKAVDGLKGWEVVEQADALLLSKILANYAPYLRDELGIGGMLSAINRGVLYYLPKQAWVLIDNLTEEGSFNFHGGKFTIDSVDEEFSELLEFLMKQTRVKAAVAFIPDHAEKAINFVKRLNFEPVGMIPFDAHYEGKLGSTMIYAKINKE